MVNWMIYSVYTFVASFIAFVISILINVMLVTKISFALMVGCGISVLAWVIVESIMMVKEMYREFKETTTQ